MRTICVWVKNELFNYQVAEEIYFAYPCFMTVRTIDSETLEIEVTCEQIDAEEIECLLSEIV